MTFWIIAALMAAAAVAVLLRPLLRRDAALAARADYDLAVYRDQLAELDRDRERGLVTADEAEAARVEIARRMLAAADGERASPAADRRQAKIAAVLLTVLVPLGALALYLPAGNPELPSLPFAGRQAEERVAREAIAREAEELARRLETEPNDVAAWIELGGRMMALDRAGEASEAYARAVGLTGGDPDITGLYAEALVAAGSGMVTQEARLAFERVLAQRPDDPRARFYLGLERSQAGDLPAALDRWTSLLADSPADAPWRGLVEEQVRMTAERLGRDVPIPAPPAAAPPGPDAADMAAAARMTGAEREEMIRGMVDGLAARLEETPDDLDGWLRLGNAYRVLGERDKAADAMARAAALAPDDSTVLAAYADALLAASDGPDVPPEFVTTMERLYAQDPDNIRALWFMGGKALAENRPEEAARLWRRALGKVEPGSEEYRIIEERLDALEQGD